MARLDPKHSLATRVFHWTNGPVLAVMMSSGLLIYRANDVSSIHLGRRVLFHFFPDWFYRVLHLDHGLALGMGWHFACAWIFALNGLAYVASTFWSGERRHLIPTRSTPRDAWHVVLHDLGLRKEPLPHRKFNEAQRVAYTGVVLMGDGSLITGLAIFRPIQVAWLTAPCGGYEWARYEHFLLTLGYVGFFIIHIAQVIRAGWNNFRSMVIGVEVVADEEPSYGQAG